MDRVIDTCGRRFGTKRAAAHFLLGPLSAEQWRRFHAIHAGHHLKQVRRIAEANRDAPALSAAQPASAGRS